MSNVVLITGASHGIGFATVEHLAQKGYHVYAGTRDPAKAQALIDLSKKVNNVFIEQLDITSDASVDTLIAKIIDKEKSLKAVVNNAGYGIFGAPDMHTMEETKDIFEVNFFSALRVTNAAMPHLRQNTEGGRVININSISGAIPSKNMSIYAASKAALESVSATYQNYNAEWKVKFVNIQPGAVLTNFKEETKIGTRLNDESNPYLHFLQKRREDWDKMMDSGQDPKVVANLVEEAISSANPQFWYQTTQAVSSAFSRHYVDLTGAVRVPPN